MRKTIIRLAALAIVFGAAATAAAEGVRLLWQGESGGFRIRWTTSDLSAQGSANFLLRPIAEASFRALKAGRGCRYDRTVRVRSIVGPYVSVHDEYALVCPRERPGSGHRLTTIDLRRPAGVYAPTGEDPFVVRTATKLTDIFPEREILAALLGDAVVKRGVKGTPATLAALQAGFPPEGVTAGTGGCNFGLPKDFLTRFAFHHLEGDKVAVRLAMEPGDQACRDVAFELGLLLGIPPALKDALAPAQAGSQGFLADRAPRGETRFAFQRK